VNLRVSGIGPITRPEIRKASTGSTGGAVVALVESTRPVCFDAADGYVETPVLWRPDLAPGTTVAGPAIVEEFGSTVPVHPGFVARVDDYLNIIVAREG
jgi:N-methylhydantoinase A